MPDSATLLALALVGVYLVDSTRFLCIGEAVVTSRRLALHRVDFGAGFELGGRRPYVPSPFTPFRPAFRVDWDLDGASIEDAQAAGEQMRARLQALRVIGILSALCGLMIVLVAPIALIVSHEPLFLVAAAGCFVSALAAATLVFVRRAAFGLRVPQALSLAFVAVVCLPCSANLARAVAAHRTWSLAASDLPLLGFAPVDLEGIRRSIREALASARRLMPEDGANLAAIDAQLRKLEGQGT